MNENTYKKFRTVVIVFMGGIFGSAMAQDTPLLAIIGIGVGLLSLFFLRRKVRQVTADERTALIQDKAGRMAFVTFTIISALVGNLILFVLKPEDMIMIALGNMFAYIAMFLLALYMAAYWFYSREYGVGNEE